MHTDNLGDHYNPTKTRIFTLVTLHIPPLLGTWLFHAVDDLAEGKSPHGHINIKICCFSEGP